jgi:UDP-N-acetylmuramoylalanine--D-glutamate ligase
MKMNVMKTEKAVTPGELRDMRVLVVGLARSGVAACRVLRDMGVAVKATDARAASSLGPDVTGLERLGVKLETGGNSVDFAQDSDLVVVSPGVPLDNPVVKWAYDRGEMVMGEVELAYCLSEARFAAVSGTNGKSTTVSLLGDMVRGATDRVKVGGNIGDPISALVAGLGPDWIAVIEVSSFQLDTSISFRPDVAVLLNITPDHLNRYPSYEAYVRSKARLFANQAAEDVAIVNYDDPDALRAAEGSPGRKLFFSIRRPVPEGAFVKEGRAIVRAGGRESELFRVEDLRIPGPHNLADSLAAGLAAIALGVEAGTVRSAVRDFAGLEHRLERVDTIAGVEFINDSKATNLDSLRCALEAVENPVVLIAGGRDKGSDWSALSGIVGRRVSGIVAIGEARGTIEKAFSGLVEVEKADNIDQAVRAAFGKAAVGTSVLLSPGCASFDMFTDFEHRGREFKRAVAQLKDEREGRGDG